MRISILVDKQGEMNKVTLLTLRTRSACRINLGKMNKKMGRISVELSDELEKKLRFKTIEEFGGKKGDLSKAVVEAVKKWVSQ
jgi:hypothetical protein